MSIKKENSLRINRERKFRGERLNFLVLNREFSHEQGEAEVKHFEALILFLSVKIEKMDSARIGFST